MKEKFKVCIDAGHGGSSNGTMALGFPEKEMTVMLARELALSMYDMEIDIVLTRYDDKKLFFYERGDVSGREKADLTLCIHVNAISKDYIHGMECYVLPGQSAAHEIAESIMDAAPVKLRGGRIVTAIDPNPEERGNWQEAPINVMQPHSDHCDVVLVECCYATNNSDRNYILSPWGRAGIVTAMRAGVVRSWELRGC